MKNILLSLAILSLLSTSLAQVKKVSNGTVYKDKASFKDTGITAEIYNKHVNPVWIFIENISNFKPIKNQNKHIQTFKIPADSSGTKNRFNFDINKQHVMGVYLKPVDKVEILESDLPPRRTKLYPVPFKLYVFKPGKTVYLTWDGSNMRPQTGPRLGLSGKTETGLSLSKNISSGDIKDAEFFYNWSK